jgi:hypothetical protein
MASRAARRLTPQQREFIELHVLDGLPMYRAYLLAFDDVIAAKYNGKITAGSACRAGGIILQKEHAKTYVEELKARVAERAQQKRFLSLDEKREFLARLVRTPIGDIDEESELAEEVRTSTDGTTSVKIPSKLKALELDARIMGEFKDSVRLDVSEKVLNLAESFA